MRAHCPLQPLLCILPGLIVHCSHCSASHQGSLSTAATVLHLTRAHCPLQPLLWISPGLTVHCSHCSASHQHCTHRTKLSNTSFDIQGTLRQGVELAVDWGQWGCSLGGQWRVPLVAIWGQWKKKEKGVGEESHTHTHTHTHTHWMNEADFNKF